VTYDTDTETGVQNIRDIKEQEVYLGSVPLMTRDGVFVVNGTERVIVSQLQRSPGLFYAHDNGKTHSSGKLLYSARIIPVRGSWIDLEFDVKDVLYVRIDRRRKFPVTTLLRALGYTSEELLRLFYRSEKISVKRKKFKKEFDPDILLGQRAALDIYDPKTGEPLVKKHRKISKALLKKMVEAKIKEFDVEPEELLGKYLAQDLVDPSSGEVIAHLNSEITESVLESILEAKIKNFEVLFIDGTHVSDSFRKTLALDKVADTDEALLEIYRRLRPSSPPTLEVATSFFSNLFFNSATYDLSEVGRFKINARLKVNTDISVKTLTKEDIVESVRYLVRLKDEQGKVDDIGIHVVGRPEPVSPGFVGQVADFIYAQNYALVAAYSFIINDFDYMFSSAYPGW